MDEATNLAVRAATGFATVTQQAMSYKNQQANALGLGVGYSPAVQTKLSPERKHRMREQATQKLAKAYRLDEIACSVATMQSASPLEEVAALVLQRSAQDSDAKYVHFFHEKIPSRHLAECTSLTSLDDIISVRRTEGEPLRTRATVRVFKEDFEGAAEDLTDALRIHRLYRPSHVAPKSSSQELQLYEKKQRNGRRAEDVILKEEDQPSSLETQLLFQRAGVYLTIACQHVRVAISDPSSPGSLSDAKDPGQPAADSQVQGGQEAPVPEEGSECEPSPARKEALRKVVEARKLVRLFAKRALRDYTAYLSHFEYSPDLPLEAAEEFARKVNFAANGVRAPRSHPGSAKPDSPDPGDASGGTPQRIYNLSELFTASPPSDLPPYPSTEVVVARPQQPPSPSLSMTTTETLTYHPLLTDALHALLLCHCLIQTSAKELLRHAYMVARLARLADGYPVFQASRSPARADWMEVLRASGNWIQLVGTWEDLCAPAPLPLFQSNGAGGSPIPISLKDPPPSLAKQARALPSPSQVAKGADSSSVVVRKSPSEEAAEAEARRKELIKRQAVIDALGDDRVGDEESFRLAIRARQLRAERDYRLDSAVAALDARLMKRGIDGGAPSEAGPAAAAGAKPKALPAASGTGAGDSATKQNAAMRRWAAEEKDYPISTERATAVARWVIEAPPNAGSTPGGEGGVRKRKKKPVKKAIGSGSGSSGLQDVPTNGVDAEAQDVSS